MAKKNKNLTAPTGTILSKYLRLLALDIETIDDDGDPVTKAEALAALVWRHALGFEEADPDNPAKVTRHRPATWAVDLLYNRIEGKVPLLPPEDSNGPLPDRISELSKATINAMSDPTPLEDPDDA